MIPSLKLINHKSSQVLTDFRVSDRLRKQTGVTSRGLVQIRFFNGVLTHHLLTPTCSMLLQVIKGVATIKQVCANNACSTNSEVRQAEEKRSAFLNFVATF